jgi:hypothetical protein
MDYSGFWENRSYAVVGDSSRRKYPQLTFDKLRQQGKEVYAVDPVADSVSGKQAYSSLGDLPRRVDAVIIETPADETAGWVAAAADAGIRKVWIHQRCDSPESISLAQEKDMELYHGTCAIMYLSEGFSVHALHGWINRRLGRY